ncbi:hypothetical protein MNB_SM-4-1230 [hydrothermal vent metagenome]|uniref:Uncharacterized protein n=1 Tax=hydrothermal vent metagenome TaxID=652676 RepID=A0A1W1CLM7_9ZZZZ
MIQKIVLICLISLNIYATDTKTHVTFTNEKSMGKDKNGNNIYERDVTIDTQNFKVKNFWSQFSFSGDSKNESEFATLSKTGTVRIKVESTSLCELYSELDEAGCSGQKPFLINNEALIGQGIGDTISLIFQQDFNGTDILYNDTNASVFYPLDVERNEKFYKKQKDNTRSFFGLFGTLFNTFFGDSSFFSSFFNFGVSDNNGNPVEDIRQRYIANIVSGIDQDHLLEKSVTPLETTRLNDPVSLIDYRETIVNNGSCQLFFFRPSESSSFCNLLSGIPFVSLFVSSTPTTTYQIDTIQVDTENSLITFASAYSEMTIDEYQSGAVYQQASDDSRSTSIFSLIGCFLFGCSESDDTDMIEQPMDTHYQFNDDTAVNLTMAVTESGNIIDDFQTFKLQGIHSLTGSEQRCTVKETNDYDTWSQYTFKPNGTESQTFTDLDNVVTETWCNPYTRSDYEDRGGYCPRSYEKIITLPQTLKTPEEWLSWCDTAIENNVVTTTEDCDRFLIWKINCRDVIDPIIVDDYEILDYVNTSRRGLILDLELIDLDVKSKAVHLRYELISTKH